ncbi:ABC transporter ATP-binding protein [Microbacterium sp. W1N]|uniref:ABC transporter ATP-binding protein n=1 Tax=Microbacterium festucae TaxID=2977531 RepID=UPI0021C1FB74|nr:ABC transporter ATP-binding protein [Microbacterium festucae]MCT9821464.1 ABC transporter ATP-binding protein [Microbacterium festucae]
MTGTVPADVLVRADALVKRFGDTTALDGVTLDFRSGECVGLLGPNGAGKTTLLTLIEGLRQPTSGTVSLFGGDPRDTRSRVHLGTTPQATALPESLRVREVLQFVAAHYPSPADRSALIEEFDLGDLLALQCGALSGGQQRRVAVALAFVGDPRLVLLDEPTTGLDVDARRALWEAVRARHAAGCTIVVTSHHLEEIERLAHRVVVIDDGRVRADDSLESIVSGVARRRVTVAGVTADQVRALAPDAAVTVDRTAGDVPAVTAVLADSDRFVRDLVASALPFSRLSVRGATLEEAFLTITKGAR